MAKLDITTRTKDDLTVSYNNAVLYNKPLRDFTAFDLANIIQSLSVPDLEIHYDAKS
jgi:hypothetical protein